MSSIAIVAAMERELAPFVRNWKAVSVSYNGGQFRVYEHENLVAIAGGIGRRAGQIAARAVIAQYKPQLLISAGLAGALLHSLKVASVITPNVIVDAATGTEYRCEVGGGVLVTADEIANATSKATLVEKFHALAVDMEAAAVAQVAQQNGIAFRCVKAISDEADFVMPPLNQFVDETGSFQNGKFVAWAALRPLQWPRIISLSRNSSRASHALCDWLKEHINNYLPEGVVHQA
ncbi:MAG TPA: hypothetical protein VKD65_15060 [Candidatus Angelobacter sp.]|nr:hypothetical protein [Candidatus Angelobacter sp.]